MNNEHRSADSPDHRVEKPLDEIEHRLRSFQPRSVNLNVDSLMASAQIQAAARTTNPTGASKPLATSRHGAFRWIAVSLGSWSCGALVGALVMAFWIGPATDTESNSRLRADSRRSLVPVDDQRTGQPMRAMESEHGRRGSEAIDTMALLTFNDLAGPDDPRSREVRTPWVGIMVPVHVHNLFSRHFVRNPPSKEGRMVEGDGRLHTQSTDHVFPRPQRPLTRNELLRALLDNDTVMAY